MGSVTSKFKEYETIFTKHQINVCRGAWLSGHMFQADPITSWPHDVSQWTQDFVQQCVYHVSDHMDWQLFRVSLKGLSTEEKLYCLDRRFKQLIEPIASDDPSGPEWVKYKIEKCRIDNYILALKRGGQLNRKLEAVR